MKEPVRFIDCETDDFTKELLDSASADEPSTRAFQSTAAALGVAGAVTAASGAASAAALSLAAKAATTARVGASASTAAPKVASLALVKWVGLGAVVGLVTAGGAGVVQDQLSPPAEEQSTSLATHDQNPMTDRGHTRTPAVLPESKRNSPPMPPPLESQPTQRKRPNSARGVPARGATAALEEPGETPLSRDIKALDRAKKALSAGKPDQALSALDDYARATRTGILNPEATVLRIEALRKQGRASEARSLAQEFVTKHPTSPHSPRLRALANKRK